MRHLVAIELGDNQPVFGVALDCFSAGDPPDKSMTQVRGVGDDGSGLNQPYRPRTAPGAILAA